MGEHQMSDAVGFVGLGKMGRPMAERLIASGFNVVVVDPRTEAAAPLLEKGADRAATPKELADRVGAAIIMVPTPEIVLDVAMGADGLIHGSMLKYCVDMGTTGSRTAIALAEQFGKRSKAFVDAPVTGALKAARSGTLTIMAAGSIEHIEGLRPILTALGKIHHVGLSAGMGQTMKLLNNLASAANMAITSEVMVLGAKAGLDGQMMLDIMNAGSGRNSASQEKFPDAVMPRTFDFGFPMSLQYKDLKLCMDEAERLRVPMWVGSAVCQLWFHWLTQGNDSRDFTTIIEMLESWAGVKIGKRNQA